MPSNFDFEAAVGAPRTGAGRGSPRRASAPSAPRFPTRRHRMSDSASISPAPGALQGPSPRVVFVAWTAYGLFFGMRGYINSFLFGTPMAPNPLWILGNLLDGWYWALLTFPVFHLALRFRFTRRRWPLAVVVHTAGAV